MMFAESSDKISAIKRIRSGDLFRGNFWPPSLKMFAWNLSCLSESSSPFRENSIDMLPIYVANFWV